MTPHLRSRRGFTLVEIMVVVAVVAILSTLAMVVVSRIRDHAVRTMIQNHLRQVYQAKEQYFSEKGIGTMRTNFALKFEGYLKASVADGLASTHSLEGSQGWRYSFFIFPGEPTYAYRGEDPLVMRGPNPTEGTWRQTAGEVIWSPAPPAALSRPRAAP